MSHFIIHLVLSTVTSLSEPATVDVLKQAYPNELKTVRQVEGTTDLFEVDGLRFIIGYLDKPMEPIFYEHPLNTPGSWAGGRKAIEGHKSYAFIGLPEVPRSYKQRLKASTVLMLVASALTNKLPVSAAIFTTGAVLVSPEDLREQADLSLQYDEPAVSLWVSFHLEYLEGPNGKKVPTAFTGGLSAFVGRDIEFPSNAMPPEELFGKIYDFSVYLIRKGPVIKDGHTVGQTATERIRVRHVDPGAFGDAMLRLSDGSVDRETLPVQ